MHWKEAAFIMVMTAVAILVVEPLIEQVLYKVSPTTAARLGITVAA